jgi:hypothetical protein
VWYYGCEMMSGLKERQISGYVLFGMTAFDGGDACIRAFRPGFLAANPSHGHTGDKRSRKDARQVSTRLPVLHTEIS